MKFENQKKPCTICKAPSFLRTDGGKPLCPIHFIMHGSNDEVIAGTGTETFPLVRKKIISQTRGT